ncbi:MAG TPA: hypothetical protein VK448_02510 [Dissulfurispiraceae bacterium]|nr:hypothetical protein [Dissulfurispiraceae bacterium]
MRAISKLHDDKKQDETSRSRKSGHSNLARYPVDQVAALQQTVGNQTVQRLFRLGLIQPKPATSPSDENHGLVRPLSDGVGEVELGHTDCDWDRNVGAKDIFVPKSGEPKVNISATEECTKPCTKKHEDDHLQRLKPICKSYFECFKAASDKAAKSAECKTFKKEDDRKKCIEQETEVNRLECFIALADKWDAEGWECEAYKLSLKCAEDLQQKGDAKCSGKLGAYIYSASQKIKKYCKTEQKETKEKPKEPEKPGRK